MVKKCSKTKSKRQTCRQKYKVQRKVAEHHRKVRKEQRKKVKSGGGSAGRARALKEVRVPNEAPFRDKVLAEAEAARRDTEARRAAARQELRNRKRKNLDEVVADATRATDAWQRKQLGVAATAADGASSPRDLKRGGTEPLERSARAFHRELEKVLAECDVLLEVLDARDPLGSRCAELEERVRAAGKRLVLILNKVDLVPRQVAAQWLQHLRGDAPTLAFKASLQRQASRLGHAPEHFLLRKPDAVAQCVGAQPLLRFLNALSRSHGGTRATLTVGVVGLPNTGKSSLINSLKREKVCGSGAVPGLTRRTQTVHLDKHLRLVDCPGVVLERVRSGVTAAQLILRNCVRPEDVADPEPAVAEVLRHCPMQRLQLHYGLPPYTDAADFLVRFARRCGMLRKGGRPDVVRAGRRLLHDWAQGRLVYYTEPPPAAPAASANAAGGAEVRLIDEFSKEFDLGSMDEAVLSESRCTLDASTDVVIESFGVAKLAPEDQEEGVGQDEEEMDSDWTESVASGDEDSDQEEAMSTDEEVLDGLTVLDGMEPRSKKVETVESTSLPSHLQKNRALRLARKKLAKRQRRSAAVQNEEDDAEVDGSDADSDYDFEEHFPV